MHFYSSATERLAQALKERVLQAMTDHKVTQQEIADATGVNQVTVGRWFSYGGDLHFPAALTSCLNSPKLRALALEILRFQAEALGVAIGIRVPLVKSINGSLDDECLDLGRELGDIIEKVQRKKDHRMILKDLDEMDEILARARLELKTMGGAS